MLFCAGLGTRLRPLTNNKPKALVELSGKSLLQWNIEKLKNLGIHDFVINIHHFADEIENYLNEHDNFGVNIKISDERQALLDTGGGLKKARHLLDSGEDILLHNVDIISNLNLQEMISFHEEHKPLASLAVRSRKTSRYLMFEDESQELTGWTNIKTGELKISKISSELVSNYGFSGIHIISPKVFDLLPEEDEFSIIDGYLEMAKSHKILCFPHEDSYWFDVGKPENLEAAEKMMIKNKAVN